MEIPEQVRDMIQGGCTVVNTARVALEAKDIRFVGNEWALMTEVEMYRIEDFSDPHNAELDSVYHQAVVLHIPSGIAFCFVEVDSGTV